MDPVKIAHKLVEPLYEVLAQIKTEAPHVRRQQGIETASARHRVRSEASKRAWITIRANRTAAKRKARAHDETTRARLGRHHGDR